jgi:hypothetical protein
MACDTLKLQSVQPHIGDDNLLNILEVNLKMYYDLAFLNIGGWSNVVIPTVGGYGGDYSILTLVDDPNYNLGQVWMAPRKDFVWEQDIEYVNPISGISSPLVVSTPRINGAIVTQPYHINYPQGKVVFDNAMPINSVVTLSYSYRNIQVYRADNATWWKELHFNSHRVDEDKTELDWSILAEHRVQLPAVVIESVPVGESKVWELGSNSKIASRQILFYVYTDHNFDYNIMDILCSQSERTIPLFDTNVVAINEAFPLDYKGELLANNHYENLANLYRWRNCRMVNSDIIDIKLRPNLCETIVKTAMEIIL